MPCEVIMPAKFDAFDRVSTLMDVAARHPGIAPTNLLAAQPGMGRADDTVGRKVIAALGRRGLLVGTPDSAALPALMAATTPDSGTFYGPSGFGHLGGPPAEQKLYSRLRSAEDAARIWDVSRELTGVTSLIA